MSEKTEVITKAEETKGTKKVDDVVTNKRPLNEVTSEDSNSVAATDPDDDDTNPRIHMDKYSVNKTKRQKKDHEENGEESNDVLDDEEDEEDDEEEEGSDPDAEYDDEDDDAVVNEDGVGNDDDDVDEEEDDE